MLCNWFGRYRPLTTATIIGHDGVTGCRECPVRRPIPQAIARTIADK
jgi:hypothetical protein